MDNLENSAMLDIHIGTIGHDKHGKTTLAKAAIKVASALFGAQPAISNINTVQIKNPLSGSTFSFSRATYSSGTRNIFHVDCTGSKESAQCLLATSAMKDGAILICSLLEGPTNQTCEQVSLCKAAGVQRIIVFLTMADLCTDPDINRVIEIEVREILSASGYDGGNVEVIQGSAQMALEGKDDNQLGTTAIKKLISALDKWTPEHEQHAKEEQSTEPGQMVEGDRFDAKLYICTKQEGAFGVTLPNPFTYSIKFKNFSTDAYFLVDTGLPYLTEGATYNVSIQLKDIQKLRTTWQFEVTRGPIKAGYGRIANIGGKAITDGAAFG